MFGCLCVPADSLRLQKDSALICSQFPQCPCILVLGARVKPSVAFLQGSYCTNHDDAGIHSILFAKRTPSLCHLLVPWDGVLFNSDTVFGTEI